MRIFDLRPVAHHGDGKFPAVATFDLGVSDSLRLTGWTLRRAPRGDFIVLPPNAHGRRAATVTPGFAHLVTQAAVAAFTELSARHETRK